MFLVRKAYNEDFNNIYKLLLDFDSPRKKEYWKNIFVDYWEKDEEHYGYVLIDKSRIVGFIGTIFSKRLINGEIINFCNTTSWITKEKYRNDSLKLFYPILKLKNYTLTNFTPSKRLLPLFKRFGYKEINTNVRILYPIPSVYSGVCEKNCYLVLKKNEIEKGHYLNKEELKIFHDHFSFNYRHLLIKSDIGNCYLIGKKVVKKKLPFLHVIFLSNNILFSKCINYLRNELLFKLKIVGIIVDERFLPDYSIPNSIKYNAGYIRLFKSELLDETNIDYLYSEMILFDHKTV